MFRGVNWTRQIRHLLRAKDGVGKKTSAPLLTAFCAVGRLYGCPKEGCSIKRCYIITDIVLSVVCDDRFGEGSGLCLANRGELNACYFR